MHRPPSVEADLAEELAVARPALGPRFAAALPGARAAVLTRLWRALAHEPLPFVAGRAGCGPRGREGLSLRLRDGRRLLGPPADPYTTAPGVTEVRLDGTAYDDPARLLAELAVPHAAGFAAELGHSVASLALSRAGQDPDDSLPTDPKEWPAQDWEWEQRVVDGHPYHPNCRARPGFSVAEQLAYGPEHRPSVRLGLLPAPAADCLVSGVWPEHLRDGARLLIPVHPWQAAHVLGRGGPQGVAAHVLGASGPGGLPAHPLMSLRTLALDDGLHVKTALSTRLTSSVRDISIGSVAASAALSAFAETLTPYAHGLLHMTRTLGAVTARSPDLAAVLRESPREYGGPGEHVVPVAALAGTELPRDSAWLVRLARLGLTVGLRMLELGVALEAHGQNLLVVLSPSGEPLRLVYRDLADIRVSPARLARHGVPLPDGLPARIVTDDVTVLRRKLFGSLVAGALAGTAGGGRALGAALESAAPDLPRTPDLVALCEEPLPAKALTLMRLSPGTPGDQWAELPNPLRWQAD
ncbi:IucA/IucC family siderophore biosynthesis protein [Streptomyces sp. NPDC054884]|uniref:IucA/IucC family siderophore biosynthesis protein n=1 Tax=Streptomyces sp. ME08-AFT2 TaxID=3028683 RepID=UPI0029A6F7F6|nr:IucA/IucC family siderophore biosynthesis protein [Streptomyces sp. ME08-AFT2]MDX3311298.1 IucA/IucC family siderophore biosynthesis protein [Streptomyces sp. ME08-AFT2]